MDFSQRFRRSHFKAQKAIITYQQHNLGKADPLESIIGGPRRNFSITYIPSYFTQFCVEKTILFIAG